MFGMEDKENQDIVGFLQPTFFEKKGEVERPILAAVFLYAPCSRYGYWFYALFVCVGPLRGAVLLARPKVPKNRTGLCPCTPAPRTKRGDPRLLDH